MPVILELLVIFIIFFILKEILSSMFNAFLVVLLVIAIFFVLGGSFGDLQGPLGSIQSFFRKLPTSQFLNLIIDVLKGLFDTIMNAFKTT